MSVFKRCLEHPDAAIRAGALQSLSFSELTQDTMAAMAECVITLLRTSKLEAVRSTAAQAMRLLDPSALAAHASSIVELVEGSDVYQVVELPSVWDTGCDMT